MRRILILLTVLFAIACSSTTDNNTQPTAPSLPSTPAKAQQAAYVGPHGFDLTGMDTSANACDDFYQYATGQWRQTHPLPSQYSRYGRFEELSERNRDVLHTILEEDVKAAATAPAGSAQQKLGDYYASCMNETAINAAGVTPIQPALDRVNAITDRNGLVQEISHLADAGTPLLFRVNGQNDFKNSRMIIASVGTGQLGLPDRDYYLRDDERFKTIRGQYIDHMTKMLTLAGEDATQARSDAGRILSLETKLAEAEMSRVEMRKPENRYHMMPVAQLAATVPNVDWNAYLSRLGVNQPELNVSEPKYMESVNRLLTEVPIEDWKTYLRWNIINTAAPALSAPFEEEEFNFNGKILSGQQQQQERWKRCVRATDQNLGQLLGQEYVRRNFTPEAKAKMNQLIDNLISALREDIPTLSWMSPETKQAALTKLNAFSRKIGYPDKWRDYSTLNVVPGSYFQNVVASRRFAFRYNISRIGKPDDPNEWGGFTPPTVNASYMAARNDITFPAGILQPPFYDPNADDGYNYGGIGVVIGHEMTHGFDDQGAKYDAQGNLRNWWTPEDLKNFNARTNCVSQEYSEFNVAPGINIKGDLVTGEEVADLGGTTLALRAYEKSLQGKKRETIDGFTPEQRFFLGFAQVWGENYSPQAATRAALTDSHAQGRFRVNGTVQNMPEFAKAFHCAEGSKMVRDAAKRCSIW